MQNIDWSSPPVAAETLRNFWDDNPRGNEWRYWDRIQINTAAYSGWMSLLEPESKLWTQVVEMKNKAN